MTRWAMTPPAALLVALLLFALMFWLIRPPSAPDDLQRVVPDVEVVQTEPDDQPEQDTASPESAPPAPPAAPPALALPDAGRISVPAVDATPLSIGPISLDTKLSSAGTKLGSIGAFGGFASGSGGGGGGTGNGSGFRSKPLVPTSTARPQMPEWACKQKIHGWVEVVFTVMPDGSVQDVRLVDADPRGVFEAAAIESVAHWIYPTSKSAREVRQRVKMDPADCAYNWK